MAFPDRARRDVRDRLLIGAVLAALLAHVAAVLLVLEAPQLWPWINSPPPAAPEPPTIEMVEDDAIAAGGAKAATGAPAVSARQPEQTTSSAPPSDAPPGAPLSTAAPAAAQAELAPPTPDRPQQLAAAAPPVTETRQPEIDLDPADGLGYGRQDDDRIIPARPDDRRANRMPVYPRAAGRRGEEGSVQMLVMIDAAGAVSRVEVAVSSGHPDLDQTATRAVSGWHFRPAVEHGRPVATQMMQTFNFHILRPGETPR